MRKLTVPALTWYSSLPLLSENMLSVRRILPVVLVLLLMHTTVNASIEQQRKDFTAAETALNKGDHNSWKKLEPDLKDYPLYADLVFKLAIRNITRTTPEDARQYLSQLDHTPLRKTYLKSWLKKLAAKSRWQNYLSDYEPDLGTRYECYAANALYETGALEQARQQAEALWLVGKSQPEYCDPVFRYMKQHGHLNDDLVWQRIELAIGKGKTGLVSYLKKQLPASEQEVVQEWLDVRNKPERALKDTYILSQSPRRQQILVYGIKRMALFEADKALKSWQLVRDKVLLDKDDIDEIQRYLALRLTTQRIDGAVDQHKRVEYYDSKGLEWAIRAALRENDWDAVEKFITALEAMGPLSDRWQYWKARQAGENGDTDMASTLYHLLAAGRGYHNFLAADQIDLPYAFNNRPLQFTEDELRDLNNHYNVSRAREYYLLDRINEARREWYYLIRQFGDEDRQKLSYIQKQWGWHTQAILTIATADYYDDLSIRFPVMYRQEIEQFSKSNNLDTSWVMALMRQESAFQHDARSSAGARGLMQLMPRTSKYVARLLGTRRPKLTDLYKPEINIRLGTYYLKKNLKDFENNKLLTTAAYNAGPHRVKQWLPESGLMDADVWAESIPFKETRGYVQRIMSYASIYDHKLGKPVVPLSQRMRPINLSQKTASKL